MKKEGELFIVATPLGNLDDITFRAIETLKTCELILCENFKGSLKLLKHYEINTQAKNLYNSTRAEDLDWLLEILNRGGQIAYISEAGTPGVSDPGAKLVRLVRSQGHKIIPIPGPSSLSTILSVSGAQANPSIFLGFLPDKKIRKNNLLNVYKDTEALLVIFESVYRIEDTLLILREIFPLAEILIGREMTKIHEELLLWKPGEKKPDFVLKGEFTLLVNNYTQKIAKDLR